jgi:rhamnosyltransferase
LKKRISIIIPVKNGITTIKQCLDAIYSQTLIDQTEVIVIDSGSTDGTLAILKEYPVRLYQIPPQDFNHGETRNYGVSLAKGELIYFTVQDATAVDIEMVERMASHFCDKKVMVVAGRQIVPPHQDKNPHHWYRPVSPPKVEQFSFGTPAEFDHLPDDKKRWVCGVDDVNAMYRKEALLNIAFKKLDFAEDMVWAADAYRHGFTILFDHSCKVWHYHHQDYNFSYKVSLLCSNAEWKYLGIIPKPIFSAKEFVLVIYRNIKYKAHLKWIVNQWGHILGKYKGKLDIKKVVLSKNIDAEAFIQKKIKTIPQGKTK